MIPVRPLSGSVESLELLEESLGRNQLVKAEPIDLMIDSKAGDVAFVAKLRGPNVGDEKSPLDPRSIE